MDRPDEILHLTRESLQTGTRALARRDPGLGRWIKAVGPVQLRRQRHQFAALCTSVISQQLGGAAARTIRGRFLALFGPGQRPRPEALLALDDGPLRASGLSRPKIRYLRGIAEAFAGGPLRRARLNTLSDAEVVETLTQLPGIGVWTAEMFLIFSLGRQDVFSSGDLALRAGVERVEGKSLAVADTARVARRWAPYRSVASLYLWKVAHHPGEAPKAKRAKRPS